jgi:hypothetical protein
MRTPTVAVSIADRNSTKILAGSILPQRWRVFYGRMKQTDVLPVRMRPDGLRDTARLSQNPAHMSTRSIRVLEWPMAVLALLIVPALVLEDRATDPRVREAAHLLNWIVWVAFCAEFAIRWVARASAKFLREAWFDLLLNVISPPFLVLEY